MKGEAKAWRLSALLYRHKCPIRSKRWSRRRDVESAAEVVRLATTARLANGAMTEIYFSPKQNG